MSQEELEKLIAADPVNEGAYPDWTQAKLVIPTHPKQSMTIRLDPDVLAWFKAHGKGYQRKIQAVLRAYMEAHQE